MPNNSMTVKKKILLNNSSFSLSVLGLCSALEHMGNDIIVMDHGSCRRLPC